MSDQPRIAIDQTSNGEWTLKELAAGEEPRFIGTSDGQIVPADLGPQRGPVSGAEKRRAIAARISDADLALIETDREPMD